MNEFIEKLISSLEEEKQRLRNLKNDCIALSDHEVIAIEEGAYNFCKDIVNQLAEEYNNDFCKWKFMKSVVDGGYFYSSGCNHKRFSDLHSFEYCPYCDKKIKVVEPKGE